MQSPHKMARHLATYITDQKAIASHLSREFSAQYTLRDVERILSGTVEVKPIAGRWYEKPRGWLSIQEQGRKLGTMPTVWFAQLKETATVVPVRVRVKTEYGTLFMHMTNYESGDIKLSLPE